jgi:arylsulfatase A-like enzyme
VSFYACSAGSEPARPRLVVLYSVCTVNKHYLQPYAQEVTFTPSLARFGAESAVLSSHRTESGVSGTAYASIYAGVQADRHGVFKHPRKLDQALYLIFEAFRDAGFGTYYWSAHQMASPALGYSQGVRRANVVRRPLEGSDDRFLALLSGLQSDPSKSALVVTAFSVTHAPWGLAQMPEFRRNFPAELEGLSPQEVARAFEIFKRNQFALQTDLQETAAELQLGEPGVERLGAALDAIYKSKIAQLDSYFGSVLDAIDAAGLRDESLIAFTADHGQQMDGGELFRWTHGPDLAPDVIDVPLIIRGAQQSIEPREVAAVTRSIDVFPTLAGLAGVPLAADRGVAGVDLSAALRGEEQFPELTAYSHGTLRHWSYFQPDLIENIWAASRADERLYTWRLADGAWSFDAKRLLEREALQPLDVHEATSRAAGRDLWNYRAAMVEAGRARHPDQAATKHEELERL